MRKFNFVLLDLSLSNVYTYITVYHPYERRSESAGLYSNVIRILEVSRRLSCGRKDVVRLRDGGEIVRNGLYL